MTGMTQRTMWRWGNSSPKLKSKASGKKMDRQTLRQVGQCAGNLFRAIPFRDMSFGHLEILIPAP